jgi:hypothetical protein
MGGGARSAPFFHINDPKKAGLCIVLARTADKTYYLYSFRYRLHQRRKKCFFREKNRWTEVGREPHALAMLLFFHCTVFSHEEERKMGSYQPKILTYRYVINTLVRKSE